ncbi:acyltransferase family protein [Mucilaginibacter sp.]|uniref:acyltransferase family protein n=1 Tax=Mucilaginibacter sp. TaxID=1882438 RepID=UPI00284A37A2|nr:acyltransferase family protein [Mucilaginibacter sp.]MDR3697540.1 acyltransferase family protein [Mucilaginibacter sp.]
MKILGYSHNISGNASIVLDSLRIFAALTVFYGHCYDQWNYPLAGHVYSKLDNLGHVSVVVFFVLSGYVIAHTTTYNNRGKLRYAQARLSRLYSVVIPALLFTAIAQIAIFYIDNNLYLHYTRGASWPRYIFSGLFINEIWFFSAAPPINGPLWSLSYEFWYYVIFGLFFYKGKGLKSYLLPVGVCLIAGPKILLMLPIWMVGNLAYRVRRPNISNQFSWILILVIVLITGFLVFFLPFLPNQVGTKPLFWAAQFITDWIIGTFVAFSLWLIPQKNKSQSKNEQPKTWYKYFRKFADLTFPLYVLHDPLLIFFRAILGSGGLHNTAQMWLALSVTLCVCLIIGNYLEKKRHLWSEFFGKLLSYTKVIIEKIDL